MKISDHFGKEPKLQILDYFIGETRAWGLFKDRFGNVRREFCVDVTGTIESGELILDERFSFSDGETDRRVWRIRQLGPNTYEGQADDIVGVASGESCGNALKWSYDMDLKTSGNSLRVHFDDWMFLQPDGVLLSNAKVSKWKIAIGEVLLTFVKANAWKVSRDPENIAQKFAAIG